ncbi:hypothetical protein NR798_18740 [Archangium gephyra]|uniref:hypothetical protein n=1 Tax=Archangium gephyra TaxID=48 RepID=UPI0035D400E0
MRNGKSVGPQAEVVEGLMEKTRFVSAIEEGLADAGSGRVHSHEAVIAEMKNRFGKHAPEHRRGSSGTGESR